MRRPAWTADYGSYPGAGERGGVGAPPPRRRRAGRHHRRGGRRPAPTPPRGLPEPTPPASTVTTAIRCAPPLSLPAARFKRSPSARRSTRPAPAGMSTRPFASLGGPAWRRDTGVLTEHADTWFYARNLSPGCAPARRSPRPSPCGQAQRGCDEGGAGPGTGSRIRTRPTTRRFPQSSRPTTAPARSGPGTGRPCSSPSCSPPGAWLPPAVELLNCYRLSC